MKGLLLKDLTVLMKQSRSALILIMLFVIINYEMLSTFLIFFASMLAVTALAYDERSGWDRFVKMLPCSDFDVVFGKYLLSYILSFGAGILSFGIMAAIAAVKGAGLSAEDLFVLLFNLAVVSVLTSVNLPLMFRFGTEKGRLFFLFISVAIMILGAMGAPWLAENLSALEQSVSMWSVLAAAFAAAVLINVGSVFISLKAYKAKR